jgi:MSHA pilin protein MshC
MKTHWYKEDNGRRYTQTFWVGRNPQSAIRNPHSSILDPRSCHGFTLVELIMTIIIIGIISVVVAPKMFDNSVFQSRGALDQVKAALRYGQKVAIAQNRSVSVNLSAATLSDCNTTLVSSNVKCVISNSVTTSPALPQTVTFDSLGRTAAATSISVGGTTITIEAETGYVH